MEIDVCFATNDRYAPHAAALIASIMANKSPDDELSFHFFSDKTTPSVQDAFRQMSRQMEFGLTIYEMSDEQFGNYPLYLGSRTAYSRLSMPRVLPDSLKKILYLDCDMIVTSSLGELYSTDISECYAAVVAETLNRHWPIEHAYFNSGMVLFNLEKYRNENLEEQAVQFGYEHSDWIRWADQDILNYIFKGNVAYLPLKWNMLLDKVAREHILSMDFVIYPYSEDETHEAENNPRIIHYVTDKKPWLPTCRHPHKASYWKHVRKTPYYKQVLREYYKVMPKKSFSQFIKSLKNMRRRIFQFRLGRNGYLRLFSKTVFDFTVKS